MLYSLLLLPFASAALWRFGGGAFTTETGVNPGGTDGARVFRAIPALAFLLTGNVIFLLTIAALFLGTMLASDGPFQAMGPAPQAPESSWLRWLPEQLGFLPNTIWHDFVGMTETGLLFMLPLAVTVFGLSGWHPVQLAIFAAAGLLFAPSYLLARVGFPTIPRFAIGQSWGEVFAGAGVGAAIAVSVLCLQS